jgi:Txe/YoeB family toxin of Txe-Axe toxin-antitoxin module
MVEEQINFIGINDVNSNVNRNSKSDSLFQESMKKTNEKFNNFLKNMKNDNFKFLIDIIDNNLYVSSIFKTNKEKIDINNDFLPKYEEKENKNNQNTENNIFVYKTKNSDDDNYIKKANESTKLNINVNNIVFIEDNNIENLDKISGRINLTNMNNNNSDSQFLRKKRNVGEGEKNNSIKQALYDEIKEIHNEYKKKAEKANVQCGLQIIEQGILNKNERIIIDNFLICIIYLDNQRINKIFLVEKGETIENDKSIIEVLEQIKAKFKQYTMEKLK